MHLTLANKIRFAMLGIIVVLSVFMSVFFPAREKRLLLSSYENEIQAMTHTVAFGVTIGLKNGDISATQSAMEFAKKDPRVRFAVLVSGGETIAGYPAGFKYDPALLAVDTLIIKQAAVDTDAMKGEILIGAGTGEINSGIWQSRLTGFAVAIGAFILGLVGAFLLTRSVVRSVGSLREVASRIEAGDLTVQTDVTTNDELSQLWRSFNSMASGLRSTIQQVEEASLAVANASAQISSSTEQMAAGIQEQTSQASEVAGAVEEMAKTIIENSKNAANTASTAKQAKQAAEVGGRVVEETVVGMKRIAEVVKQSAGTVQELGKSSDQIGQIIGVIDDIADQTNLLALNAAIEAARAGEQGRGFAVVADEVRKLAERTTKATKEIAAMIKKIQVDTRGAVSSMEEGTKQVDEGIKLADKAGSSLKEIVEISQRVTDMVSQIAAASGEQSSAGEQISKNVEAISNVTNETATGIHQIAEAAEDLNRLTVNLQQLLGAFTLSESGHERRAADSGSTSGESGRRPNFRTAKSKTAVRGNGELVPHS